MELILPLLKEDMKMQFLLILEHISQIGPTKRLMEMLAPKTNKLEISYRGDHYLNKFNQQFPGFITGLQSIFMQSSLNQIDMDFVVKWLTTPRKDGKAKMLEIEFDYCAYANAFITRVKTVSNVKIC